MKMMLAENIRRFRKARSLTQEHLSEALGVTAGAVYKWEANLSIPELELIVEMADFFDTSVDVLLGYEIKDNRMEATVKRLQNCRRQKNWEGLSEAEKALKKYPNSFQIVRESAVMYRACGFESGDRELLRRALELLEQSRLLLDQNTDPEVSEQTISGQIAETYLGLEETEKGIELLKKNNAGGLFNSKIGHNLAMCDRTEEAAPYLSEALAMIITNLCDVIIGYMNVFAQRKDYASAEAILNWGVETFLGLRKDGRPNYFDKVNSIFLAAIGEIRFESGREDAARESLIKAKELAAFFDAAPSYDESDIRFIDRIEGASAHDDMGATAMEAIENIVRKYENEAFTALWNHIREEE
jgi:transcriptional regulator with XRE-family HTH domain